MTKSRFPILVAEDDPVSRRLLQSYLDSWSFDTIQAENGDQAWERLQVDDPPRVALLDWMMPGRDGLSLIRDIRRKPELTGMFIILVTGRDHDENIIQGLQAGADDYIIKPFNAEELRARLNTGTRIVNLQKSLEGKIKELNAALEQVQQLHGLLPICSYCKKIRTDDELWEQMEVYISNHTEAEFSHGICPVCYEEHIAPHLKTNT